MTSDTRLTEAELKQIVALPSYKSPSKEDVKFLESYSLPLDVKEDVDRRASLLRAQYETEFTEWWDQVSRKAKDIYMEHVFNDYVGSYLGQAKKNLVRKLSLIALEETKIDYMHLDERLRLVFIDNQVASRLVAPEKPAQTVAEFQAQVKRLALSWIQKEKKLSMQFEIELPESVDRYVSTLTSAFVKAGVLQSKCCCGSSCCGAFHIGMEPQTTEEIDLDALYFVSNKLS